MFVITIILNNFPTAGHLQLPYMKKKLEHDLVER